MVLLGQLGEVSWMAASRRGGSLDGVKEILCVIPGGLGRRRQACESIFAVLASVLQPASSPSFCRAADAIQQELSTGWVAEFSHSFSHFGTSLSAAAHATPP